MTHLEMYTRSEFVIGETLCCGKLKMCLLKVYSQRKNSKNCPQKKQQNKAATTNT